MERVFFLPEKIKPVKYRITSAGRVVANELVVENYSTAEVLVKLLEANSDTRVFSITKRVIECGSNTELIDWSDEVNSILNQVVLKTNIQGRIEKILNVSDIVGCWNKKRGVFKKQVRKKASSKEMFEILDTQINSPDFLLECLKRDGAMSILFHSFLGKYTDGEKKNKKVHNNFFRKVSLPLIETATMTEHENQYDIAVVAELDKEVFNKKAFSRFVKDITDVYNARARLDISFEEKYTLNKDYQTTIAEQYLSALVPMCYSVTLARTLEQVQR